MTRLTQNPEMDSVGLGKAVVDTYREYYLSGPEKDDSITLSVIDLSKIDALSAAIDGLSISNQTFIKSGGRPSLSQYSQ